jgi:hypothetical protein
MFISLFHGPQYNKRGMFSLVHERSMLTALIPFYGCYLQGLKPQLHNLWRVAAVTLEGRYILTPFLGRSAASSPTERWTFTCSSQFLFQLGPERKRESKSNTFVTLDVCSSTEDCNFVTSFVHSPVRTSFNDASVTETAQCRLSRWR